MKDIGIVFDRQENRLMLHDAKTNKTLIRGEQGASMDEFLATHVSEILQHDFPLRPHSDFPMFLPNVHVFLPDEHEGWKACNIPYGEITLSFMRLRNVVKPIRLFTFFLNPHNDTHYEWVVDKAGIVFIHISRMRHNTIHEDSFYFINELEAFEFLTSHMTKHRLRGMF